MGLLSVEKCNSLQITEADSAGSVAWSESSMILSLMDGNGFSFGLFPLGLFLKVGLMGQRLRFDGWYNGSGYVLFQQKSVLREYKAQGL